MKCFACAVDVFFTRVLIFTVFLFQIIILYQTINAVQFKQQQHVRNWLWTVLNVSHAAHTGFEISLSEWINVNQSDTKGVPRPSQTLESSYIKLQIFRLLILHRHRIGTLSITIEMFRNLTLALSPGIWVIKGGNTCKSTLSVCRRIQVASVKEICYRLVNFQINRLGGYSISPFLNCNKSRFLLKSDDENTMRRYICPVV